MSGSFVPSNCNNIYLVLDGCYFLDFARSLVPCRTKLSAPFSMHLEGNHHSHILSFPNYAARGVAVLAKPPAAMIPAPAVAATAFPAGMDIAGRRVCKMVMVMLIKVSAPA